MVEFALVAPIMLFIMFAILDLARIWTTMMSVESAAREAADYGTFYGAESWQASGYSTTVTQMRDRACVAASDLPDFAWTDTNGNNAFDPGEVCTNPTFAYELIKKPSGTVVDPSVDEASTDPCANPDRDPPCNVRVNMTHVFHLFVPLHLDFFGVQLGFPNTVSFERDSIFAITDIDVED